MMKIRPLRTAKSLSYKERWQCEALTERLDKSGFYFFAVSDFIRPPAVMIS